MEQVSIRETESFLNLLGSSPETKILKSILETNGEPFILYSVIVKSKVMRQRGYSYLTYLVLKGYIERVTFTQGKQYYKINKELREIKGLQEVYNSFKECA